MFYLRKGVILTKFKQILSVFKSKYITSYSKKTTPAKKKFSEPPKRVGLFGSLTAPENRGGQIFEILIERQPEIIHDRHRKNLTSTKSSRKPVKVKRKILEQALKRG